MGKKSPHLVISTGKRQAPVFDVFEAFLNTDSIQVFANAATSYIMCLMKFVKGLGKYFYFLYISLTYSMLNLILPEMRILLCNTEHCREKRGSVQNAFKKKNKNMIKRELQKHFERYQ